jgi:hypothetical protein
VRVVRVVEEPVVVLTEVDVGVVAVFVTVVVLTDVIVAELVVVVTVVVVLLVVVELTEEVVLEMVVVVAELVVVLIVVVVSVVVVVGVVEGLVEVGEVVGVDNWQVEKVPSANESIARFNPCAASLHWVRVSAFKNPPSTHSISKVDTTESS